MEKKLPWNDKNSKELFNFDELRHLAVNYAITSLKGYNGSFENWYSKISPRWKEIANRKPK